MAKITITLLENNVSTSVSLQDLQGNPLVSIGLEVLRKYIAAVDANQSDPTKRYGSELAFMAAAIIDRVDQIGRNPSYAASAIKPLHDAAEKAASDLESAKSAYKLAAFAAVKDSLS